MGDNSDEFCKSAKSATKNGTSFTFFRYSKHLRYDSEGVYNYGSKIAHIDLTNDSKVWSLSSSA